ncbi:hypothetical protein F5B21DRAFT_502117 [Xylaria acuta]|nr:hypothetical protein F5B21DRAFT_502117 [Xylaria acuta]
MPSGSHIGQSTIKLPFPALKRRVGMIPRTAQPRDGIFVKFVNGLKDSVYIDKDKAELQPAMLDNGCVPLKMKDEDEVDQTAFSVGKRGRSAGQTFGVKNGIEAVDRGTDLFSAKGDSGSSVFDMQGHVIGLITGSGCDLAMIPKGADITFAAPIKWVLDDIQDFTGLRPRLT